MIVGNRRAFLSGLAGWGGLLAFGPEVLSGAKWSGRLGLGSGLDALDFGRFEALAALMQELAPDVLQQRVIEELRAGVPLGDLVAAAALANARNFGGHDYTGYHCFMALMPAFEMAREVPGRLSALPVLKVLYRTAAHIQSGGGRRDRLLALPESAQAATSTRGAEAQEDLWNGFVARDIDAAERAFHSTAHVSAAEALGDVQSILRETLDVHRIVLAWRAWDVLQLTGEAHAETLLRQSLRFCIDSEVNRVRRGHPTPTLRALLPELIEEHGLSKAERGARPASDAELEDLAGVVFSSERDDAARAMAAALGSGLAHEDAGRALSLAANRLLLHDPGRRVAESEDKPIGSVHGASVGVHASDAARAWRNLASVSSAADAAANLIAGAHHTAGQSRHVGKEPYPFELRRRELEGLPAEALRERLARAVADKDQSLAGACVAVYGALDADPEPVFATLLATAVDSDGALHAEKYFRTVREDFASARKAHRWQHAVGLARVSASESGVVAPGLAQARAGLA